MIDDCVKLGGLLVSESFVFSAYGKRILWMIGSDLDGCMLRSTSRRASSNSVGGGILNIGLTQATKQDAPVACIQF